MSSVFLILSVYTVIPSFSLCFLPSTFHPICLVSSCILQSHDLSFLPLLLFILSLPFHFSLFVSPFLPHFFCPSLSFYTLPRTLHLEEREGFISHSRVIGLSVTKACLCQEWDNGGWNHVVVLSLLVFSPSSTLLCPFSLLHSYFSVPISSVFISFLLSVCKSTNTAIHILLSSSPLSTVCVH